MAEIHAQVFGVNKDASIDELPKLASADVETLDSMLTLALQSGNVAAARQVLAAHARDNTEHIIARWRDEVVGGEDDLALLGELDVALSDDQLAAQLEGDMFGRLAPDALGWADLLPRAGRVGW